MINIKLITATKRGKNTKLLFTANESDKNTIKIILSANITKLTFDAPSSNLEI